MTINRDKLITLLTDQTGMSRQEVEQQLDELTSRILEAAKRGKALEIKGFGLFYFDEDGELTFRAADKLDSEINFSHAGMEPVELEPSKTADASPSADEQAGEVTDEDASKDTETDEIGETADQDDKADEIFGIGETLTKKDEESDMPDAFRALFQVDEGDDSDKKEKESGEEESNIDLEPEAEPQEELSKAGTAPAGKAKSHTPATKTVKKSRDPMVTIIVVVISAVFLFGAYFVFTEFLNPPEQGNDTSQEQTAELDDPPVTAERDITESTEPEEPEPVQVPEPENDPEPLDDPVDEVTTTDPYGLYGELAETDGDIFTIVVHSFRSRNVAERTAQELREREFRVSVSERTVDGENYFRVGIGQFPTIREAQQEASTLPDPYNSQNFIQRLQ
jgi:nucleoid DNA-binding protein/cell division septation protein DedD